MEEINYYIANNVGKRIMRAASQVGVDPPLPIEYVGDGPYTHEAGLTGVRL